MFKGLLFLDVGAVVHATQVRELGLLGGLGKRMPVTGATFFLGATAIAGLPPLNGFLSEFLIYAAAVLAVVQGTPAVAVAAATAAVGLALIGGLASACFANAYGMIFLGEPRSAAARAAHEAHPAMQCAGGILAALCVVIALGAALYVVPWSLLGVAPTAGARGILLSVLGAGWLLAGAGVLSGLARRLLLRTRDVGSAVTWDCGYAAPTARMQYTAPSFVQPLTEQFSPLLQTETHVELSDEALPPRATFHSHTPDVIMRHVYLPLVGRIVRVAHAARIMQQGRVQVYVLYMVLALLALFIWTFW